MVADSGLLSFLTIRLALSKNSIRHVLSRVHIYEAWLDGQIPAPELAEKFLFELQPDHNNNTLNTYIFSFRCYDKFLTAHKLPGAGFSERLNSLPKYKPPIEILTYDEIKKLLCTNVEYGKFRGLDCSRLNGLYLTLTRFLAVTGCRYNEARSLKVRYVDLIEGKVTFIETKNKDWRFQWIKEPLISELNDLIEDKNQDDYVFTTMMGNPVPPQNYLEDLKLRTKQAGIKKRVHPHLFRHSYATDLYWNGVGIGEIMELLGHRDIKTTMGYIHNYRDQLIEAASNHSLYTQNLSVPEALKIIEGKIDRLKIDRFNNIELIKSVNENEITINIRGSPKSGKPHSVA